MRVYLRSTRNDLRFSLQSYVGSPDQKRHKFFNSLVSLLISSKELYVWRQILNRSFSVGTVGDRTGLISKPACCNLDAAFLTFSFPAMITVCIALPLNVRFVKSLTLFMNASMFFRKTCCKSTFSRK